jgi:hypothetical protein
VPVYIFHRRQIETFKRRCPGHGLPKLSRLGFYFTDNGDLIEITATRNGRRVDTAKFDGPALAALSQDAWKVCCDLRSLADCLKGERCMKWPPNLGPVD